MATFVGIDEAGFGPILGPLVVSSTAFTVPEHLMKSNMWRVLHKSVYKKKKHLAGRLLITDSKKAYNRRAGTRHLNRTVLSFLRCIDINPSNIGGLLKILCPDSLARLGTYPWYRNTADARLAFHEADISIASDVLKDDMKAAGIKFLGFNSSCLDVGHFNELVTVAKNKSSVLFTAISGLIIKAFENFGNEPLQIVIDRQGGRVRYRKILQRMFDQMDLKILYESPKKSSYELKSDSRTMRLHFIVGADMAFLPVSLASMVSKFIRELLIENINSYFTCRCSDLKPTAGYWKDGERFIKDLKRSDPALNIDMTQLVRCR